jgi:outer membrane protein assembly factor BamA
VNLAVRIDQGAQYRVGSIELLGMNAMMQERLAGSLPKPGEILDRDRLEEFCKANRAILPSGVSRDDMSVRRDTKARTVAILFDFRTCPTNAN